MATNRFGLNQQSEPLSASIVVPGCSKRSDPGENSPIIYIEIEHDEPVMYIYADINQDAWTHRIALKDALESHREEDTE